MERTPAKAASGLRHLFAFFVFSCGNKWLVPWHWPGSRCLSTYDRQVRRRTKGSLAPLLRLSLVAASKTSCIAIF